MECREWKERVSAHVDGETPPGEILLVEEHLRNCAACRAFELRSRAVAIGVARTEAEVPFLFREKLFARMESEDLLRKRRSLFAYSLRWAAIPLAAAAALAFFLLLSVERGGNRPAPSGRLPQVAQRAPANETMPPPSVSAARREGALTPEDLEILAHLEVLEDPSAFEETGEIDEMEISPPAGSGKG